MVSGGQSLEEKEREQAVAKREYQLQLKKQQKKAQKLLKEKQQREEDIVHVEK